MSASTASPQGLSLQEKVSLFHADLPLVEASTIPKLWYLDADIYELERRTVFANSWQLAGRLDRLQNVGQYITAELGGERVVVSRAKDNQLHAFANVCRHRAAKVATEPCGTANKFVCHYHGWTYSLDGHMLGAPAMKGVCNFKKDCNSLPRWSVGTWGPYVFVHQPGPKAPMPLAEYMGPLVQQSATYGLERLKYVGSREYSLACNWKLFVDNYLDGGYHVNTIHKGLAGVINYKDYRSVVDGNTAVQISPLKAGDDAAITSVRSGKCAYYWWIMPNIMFDFYEGFLDMMLVIPDGIGRCKVVFDFFFEHTEGVANQAAIEQSIKVADKIQQEDVAICEEVQAGLSSRFFETGRFSPRESAGYAFHQLLARQLQAGVDK